MSLQSLARSASEGIGRSILSPRCLFALALPALLLATLGCSPRPYVNAHIDSVNAEYRQLEDYVYSLEAENARLQQEIDALKTTGAATATPGTLTVPSRSGTPRRAPSSTPGRSTPPAGGRSSGSDSPAVESPSIELPSSPGSSTPPSSKMPRSTTQRPVDDADRSAPADSPPRIDLPPLLEVPAPSKPAEPSPLPSSDREILHPGNPKTAQPKLDKKITHLHLNPALTSAVDFDGQPGDDGLRIVLEPRNAEENFVSEPGSVSIVVLNPDLQGDAARVARWDFDAPSVRQWIADSSATRGIKLEMPWPASVPNANRLKLFVRYETPDGRRLQADKEIYMNSPGQALSRWTPRSAERATAEVTTASAVSTEGARPNRSSSR